MHWYREGARQRSRILYVFRSPGGVRVGRESLEPDVLRDIEAHHPDIAFDWKAVFDNRQVVDTTPDMRRPRKRRRDEEPAPPIEPAAPSPVKPQPPAPARGSTSGAEAQAADSAPPRPAIPAARSPPCPGRTAESGRMDRCGSDRRRVTGGARSARAPVTCLCTAAPPTAADQRSRENRTAGGCARIGRLAHQRVMDWLAPV